MLSLLFRSKARLERELAVERCRREHGDAELLALKARLQETETAHARLIDQVLARMGVITSPLRSRTSPQPSSSPFATAMAALSRDTLTPPAEPTS